MDSRRSIRTHRGSRPFWTQASRTTFRFARIELRWHIRAAQSNSASAAITTANRGRGIRTNLNFAYQGPCIAGRNRENGEVTRLFNPRTDNWPDHFTWVGPRLVRKTTVGRVTIDVLKINMDYRLVIRAVLIADCEFAPAA